MHMLTKRESEILLLIGQAKSSKEIAGLLGISPHTVSNHRKHLCRKLGVHSAVGLVVYAAAFIERQQMKAIGR